MHENTRAPHRKGVVVLDAKVADRPRPVIALLDALDDLPDAATREDDITCSQFMRVDPAARQRVSFILPWLQLARKRSLIEVAALHDPEGMVHGRLDGGGAGFNRDQGSIVDTVLASRNSSLPPFM